MNRTDEINELMLNNDKEALAEKLLDIQVRLQALHVTPLNIQLTRQIESLKAELSNLHTKYTKETSRLEQLNGNLQAELSALKEGVDNALSDLRIDGHTQRGVYNAIAELEKVTIRRADD